MSLEAFHYQSFDIKAIAYFLGKRVHRIQRILNGLATKYVVLRSVQNKWWTLLDILRDAEITAEIRGHTYRFYREIKQWAFGQKVIDNYIAIYWYCLPLKSKCYHLYWLSKTILTFLTILYIQLHTTVILTEVAKGGGIGGQGGYSPPPHFFRFVNWEG